MFKKSLTPINGISTLKVFSATLFSTPLRGEKTQKITYKVLKTSLIAVFSILFLFGGNSLVAKSAGKGEMEVHLTYYTAFIGSIMTVGGEYAFQDKMSAYVRIGNWGYT